MRSRANNNLFRGSVIRTKRIPLFSPVAANNFPESGVVFQILHVRAVYAYAGRKLKALRDPLDHNGGLRVLGAAR